MKRVALAAAVVLGGACGGCSAVHGAARPEHSARPATAAAKALPATSTTAVPAPESTTTTTVVTAPAGPPVILRGDGIDATRFGQSASSAISYLDTVLGASTSSAQPPQCGIDRGEQWALLTAFFFRGVFVGYGTWAANGRPLPHGNMETTMGLRVGDTLSAAQAMYGKAFQISYAQGGSWSATAPDGTVIGLLSNVPNAPGPPPTIVDIAAGNVGCPAMTP